MPEILYLTVIFLNVLKLQPVEISPTKIPIAKLYLQLKSLSDGAVDLEVQNFCSWCGSTIDSIILSVFNRQWLLGLKHI